ncbi:MAG: class I adenylate-forming enzyme family protein [Polaromonas sp.]|uniref:class I adenylate-forming enzyme family protein n=1 Tax=Polaromonas sp. TaxID=1869339 RepID=UPI0027358360|nr:class I adenylate-forming enzyme family protein [Polaromonas sp.]MDP3796680.1 class I adenylate-forming enzyme family protein [Polaromonas sp.]
MDQGRTSANHWQLPATQALRREAHFDSRVVPCFAVRPAGLATMMRQAALHHLHAEALVDGEQRWNWQQLQDASLRVAHGLRHLGVNPGDRVALLMGNRAEFVLALYGIAQLGAVAVPMSTRDSAKGVGFILNQCGARAVIAQADMAGLLPARLDDGTPLVQVLCSHAAGSDAPTTKPSTPWENLLDAVPARALHDETKEAEEAEEAEEAPAIIVYTSGTTGQPKGAVITHFNVVHSTLHYQTCLGLAAGERAVLAVPGSHVTGIIAIVATMGAVAGCVIILREFKAAAFLQLATRERMSYTLMVPAMYALCLREPGFAALDLSAWRLGGFGGAPMPVSTIEQLGQHCPGVRLFNAYGATETTSPATITPPGSLTLDAVGVAVPCADIRIMDDDGREVPPGQSGEVWIGGPMVVPRYWDNPQATALSFCGGYWKSGDIGTLDTDGFLRIHDRKKDMINRGGYKVFSVEVENCLMGHPRVLEAAAVGVPCPVLGERVHVFVHASADGVPGEALAEELKSLCRRDLADYKVPDAISFTASPLPRNANGKLLKRELRERLLSADGAKRSG